jgi:hypothetical protein
MKRLVLITIFLSSLAGGVAYATIPDGGGVFHACMLKKLGTIRLIDPTAGQQCASSLETAVEWSRQGPPGTTGPAGPQGPRGEQGERGPSDLFHQNWNLDAVPLAERGGLTTIRSLSVPAGSYLVTAQAEMLLVPGEPSPGSRDFPGCNVYSESDIPFAGNAADLSGPSRLDTFEIAGSISLTEPATIELRCTTGTGSAIQMRALGQLLALRVGSITRTD